jgi:nucleotide-binding universal stress UspA family protein
MLLDQRRVACVPSVAARRRRGRTTGEEEESAMQPITRILCPVDFSEFSERALHHGAAIARWYDAKVTAVHVFAVPAALGTVLPQARGAILTPDGRAELLNDLRSFTEPVRESGVGLEATVREGDVVSEIQRLAEAMPADLIVMGTHGRRGYERWLLGSVTERVLRSVTCPVLTVPRAAAETAVPPTKWTTILCPVDFSPSSTAALQYALTFAQQADAQLVLLHVVEWFLDQAALAGVNPELARYYRALRDEAHERLDALVPAEARDWCRVETAIEGGRPYERILQAAERRAASLVVIGAQGRGGARLAVFGSTTQHVVRGATCPVLSVRAARSDDASRT